MADTPQGPEAGASARGVVIELETHQNSRGEPWVIITLATTGGTLSGVCFPRSLSTLSTPLILGAQVFIHGQVSSDGTELRIIDVTADEPGRAMRAPGCKPDSSANAAPKP